MQQNITIMLGNLDLISFIYEKSQVSFFFFKAKRNLFEVASFGRPIVKSITAFYN